MNLLKLFSPCFFFGHDDPIKVVSGKHLHFQCPSCQEDLGRVLPKQRFRARKPEKPLRVVRPAARVIGGRFQ